MAHQLMLDLVREQPMESRKLGGFLDLLVRGVALRKRIHLGLMFLSLGLMFLSLG